MNKTKGIFFKVTEKKTIYCGKSKEMRTDTKRVFSLSSLEYQKL